MDRREQDRQIDALISQGYQLLTWIKQRNSEKGRDVAVLARRVNDGTQYREVQPDGTVTD